MDSTLSPATAPTVVVIGGHGYFGKLVVDDLLSATGARVVVAGRTPRHRDGWDRSRVELATLDQHNETALRRLLATAQCTIHAAGPYQELEPTVLRACLAARVPYIDLADDREFVRRAEREVAARKDAPPVALGMSFVPGLCAALVAIARREMPAPLRVRCVARPGTRGSRGLATLQSLLSHAGRRFELPRGGREVNVFGWSEPRRIEFPPPAGPHAAYLAIPVADFDLFPRWFGCRDVEFRAASDQPWLDRALWLGAALQRCLPARVLPSLARPMASLVKLAGAFGTDAGSGLVEVEDSTRVVRVGVVAPSAGERLPALPASIAAAELLRGRGLNRSGLIPACEAIPPSTLLRELERRGITTWIDSGAGWNRLSFADA
jgi:NAD(P)-dependent dehydrogenase (short-subunit alcohol dehydrogenase family)